MRISITKPFFDLLTKQEKRAQKANDAATAAAEIARAARLSLEDTLTALAVDAGGGGEIYSSFAFGHDGEEYFLQLTPEQPKSDQGDSTHRFENS